MVNENNSHSNTVTLKLGDVDLSGFIVPGTELLGTPRIKPDNLPSKFEEAIQSLKERLNNSREFERLPLSISYASLLSTKYPVLYLDFLSLNNEKILSRHTKHKKKGLFGLLEEETRTEVKSIKVPKFSIYPYFGSNELSIEITYGGFYSFSSFKHKGEHACSCVEINDRDGSVLPEEIEYHLLKALGASYFEEQEADRIDNRFYYTDSGAQITLLDEQGNVIRRVSSDVNIYLRSSFNGIIPLKVQREVDEALKYFDKEEIFLVAETKPEDWTIEYQKIQADPLIVGVKRPQNRYANLISSFNTTSLEDLIRYTHNKMNMN